MTARCLVKGSLSERQLRRIEEGESTSTTAMEKLAHAHGLSIDSYLERVGTAAPIASPPGNTDAVVVETHRRFHTAAELPWSARTELVDLRLVGSTKPLRGPTRVDLRSRRLRWRDRG
jgi:hypothetical protein